jgi:Ca2+-transporting ATPase
MTEHQVGELLLGLAFLFTLTYLLTGLLERRRIPGILAALFISMAVRYIPLGGRLLSSEFHASLSFLADLGVLFFLFFIGL